MSADVQMWGEDNSGHDTACDCKACLIDEWLAEVNELRAENERFRAALERLTDVLADVRVSGLAARTHALGEAWDAARKLTKASERRAPEGRGGFLA